MRWFVIASIVGFAVLACPIDASAQHVVKDYVFDRHAYYSPDDYYTRGAEYRTHTGHAGLFRHCDDDALKRYSPYVHWRQRPDPACRLPYYRPIPAILADLDERVTRLVQGAGACACGRCQARKAKSLVPSVRYPR